MIESGPGQSGLVGSKSSARLSVRRHHRRRHGRDDLQGRRRPRRADRVPARVDGAALPLRAAEDGRRLARAGGRQHHLHRPTRRHAAHRPAQRRLLSRTGVSTAMAATSRPSSTSTRSSATSTPTSSSAGARVSTSTRAPARFEEKVAGPLGMDVIEGCPGDLQARQQPLPRPPAQDDRAARARPARLHPVLLRRHRGHACRRVRRGARRAADRDPVLGLGPRRLRPDHLRHRPRGPGHPADAPTRPMSARSPGSTTSSSGGWSSSSPRRASRRCLGAPAAGDRHALPAPGAHPHRAGRFRRAARRRRPRGRCRALRGASTRRNTAKESAYREAGIELVSFRLRGEGERPQARTSPRRRGRRPTRLDAIVKRVEAWVPLADEMREVDGYDFERLSPGARSRGRRSSGRRSPPSSWHGQVARVDEYKNLVITTSGRPEPAAATAAAGEVSLG